MQTVMEILPNLVESLGFRKQYKSQLILFYWEKIVGPDIAAQSVAVNVEYGTLFIAVKNSVWCHHLSMMKSDLISKVNQFVGELMIKDVRFKNQFCFDAKNMEIEEEPDVNLAAELDRMCLDRCEIVQAERECGGIGEDRLKRRMIRIYRQHLLLNKYKRSNAYHPCENCAALCPKEQLYCSMCAVEQKQLKAEKIRSLLCEVPWATYGEINQEIGCMSEEYVDAKITLLRRIAEQVQGDDPDVMNAKILTMLFTGAKPDELNLQLVEKTLAKFRRKVYVSAPRG